MALKKKKTAKRKTAKRKATKRNPRKKTTKKKVAKRNPRKKTAKRKTTKKKTAKRKTKKKATKRKTKNRRRRNPVKRFDGEAVIVGLPRLTREEDKALDYIASRYTSGEYLREAYDDEKNRWDLDGIALAYIATRDDGGDIGTVPLAGGSLGRKISILFEELFDHEDDLSSEVAYEYFTSI